MLSNVVNQPQKDMYHWKAEYWVSTFHLICRTAHGKEVIIGYIFRQWWGQMTSNWSKTLKGRILKLLPFICYFVCQGIRKSNCCGHGGHLRSHFRSWIGQMTSNCSKTLKSQILKSLPFIWYVTWNWIKKSHCCGHGGHLSLHFRSWWGQMTSNLS